MFSNEKKVAIAAIVKACDIAKNIQKRLTKQDVIFKEDSSPVTIADFVTQVAINFSLLQGFPSYPIMGEEDELFLKTHPYVKARVLEELAHFYPLLTENDIFDLLAQGNYDGGKKGRFWVVDPIDGTKGFVEREQYAVAIALIDNGEVILGGLGCPSLPFANNLGGILFAVKEQKTHFYSLDTEQESLSKVSHDKDSREIIYCEQNLTSKKHSHSKAFEIVNLLHGEPKPFRLDSQCKYALVAAGEAPIYLRVPVAKVSQEKIWDHAPGMIVVEEAGGKVTDLRGKPLDFSLGKTLSDNFGIIATNGYLHDQVVTATQKVLSDT